MKERVRLDDDHVVGPEVLWQTVDLTLLQLLDVHAVPDLEIPPHHRRWGTALDPVKPPALQALLHLRGAILAIGTPPLATPLQVGPGFGPAVCILEARGRARARLRRAVRVDTLLARAVPHVDVEISHLELGVRINWVLSCARPLLRGCLPEVVPVRAEGPLGARDLCPVQSVWCVLALGSRGFPPTTRHEASATLLRLVSQEAVPTEIGAAAAAAHNHLCGGARDVRQLPALPALGHVAGDREPTKVSLPTQARARVR
mmetsp:Transcript_112041/g.304148  ORF Transcript_112041/g.304148 Transcript_112041/m.304148 type:complete len:259 (-) Transcript_112041:75-851(-)